MRGGGLAALAILALAAAAGAARAETLPETDCAGVYWDLTAQLAGGHRVYARVLLTRAGPGEVSAAALGHWIDPDGRVTRFQNGRGKGGFQLDPGDGRGPRLRIGSTRLDLAGPEPRFEVDNDKRGVKLAVSLGAANGEDVALERPFEVAVLRLAADAAARLWRTGMPAPLERAGRATLVRTRHTLCEQERAVLRVDVHGLDAPWLLIHQRYRNGSSESWLGWRAPGSGSLRSIEPRVALEGWREVAGAGPLPARLRVKGPGAGGAIAIGAARLSVDPLDALPRWVRMLYWFGARPRRVWTDASSSLALEPVSRAAVPPTPSPGSDSPAKLASGAAIASFSFHHPPDVPNPSPPDSGG